MFALPLPSLSLAACAVQSGEPAGPDEKLGQFEQEQAVNTPPDEGGSFHVDEPGTIRGPIRLGTTKNGYCCGIAMVRSQSVLLGLVCVVLLAACKGKSTTIVGSCDEPKVQTHSWSTCSDYYDKKLLKGVCTGSGAKLSDKPCDRTGAVAACRDDYGYRWYYADSDMDAQQLSKVCGSNPTVLPNGVVFTPKSATQVNAEKVAANIAKYGAQARANLATVAAIAKKPLPVATNKVDLQGLKGGALVVHAEDLADIEHPKTLAYRLSQTKYVGECSRALGGRATPKEEAWRSMIARCARCLPWSRYARSRSRRRWGRRRRGTPGRRSSSEDARRETCSSFA
jgi:hypothetical protein